MHKGKFNKKQATCNNRICHAQKVDFSTFCQCLLEDFMCLTQNSVVYVVVPHHHQISVDKYLQPTSTISFNKNFFKVHSFNVHLNPKEKEIEGGITPADLSHGLGAGNCGVTMEYCSSTNSNPFTQLVTWINVLNGF